MEVIEGTFIDPVFCSEYVEMLQEGFGVITISLGVMVAFMVIVSCFYMLKR